MLIIRIELHSARTGEVKEIGRAKICNVGTGTRQKGHYYMEIFRRGSNNRLWRTCRVVEFPRLRLNAWHLLLRSLRAALEP